MKRKVILKLLSNEIDKNLPDCLNYCKNKRVVVEELPSANEKYVSVGDEQLALAKTQGGLHFNYIFVGLFMLILTAIAIALPLLNLGKKAGNIFNNIMTKVSLDINPSFDLLIDENNKVVACFPKNSHAELLVKNHNFSNQNINDVAVKIVNLAAKAGYIDVCATPELGVKNAVMLSIVSANEETENNVKNNLNTCVEDYFKNSQIYGVVLSNQNNKQELIALVNAITENEEDLSKKSVKELNKMLAEGYKNLEKQFGSNFIKENYEERCKDIFKNYEKTKSELENKIIELKKLCNNFEENWQLVTQNLKQQAQDLQTNIALKENLVLDLTQQLDSLTGNEQMEIQSQINIELNNIINLNNLLSLKNIEIIKHEERGIYFEQQKTYAQQNLNENEVTFKKLIEDHIKIKAHELDVAKLQYPNITNAIEVKRAQIFENTLDVYNQHFNNINPNNNFNNGYDNWKIIQKDNIKNLNNNWHDSFKTYTNLFKDYVSICA